MKTKTIKQTHPSRKKGVIIVTTLLLLLVATLGIVWYFQLWPFQKHSQATYQEQQTGSDIKNQAKQNQDTNPSASGSTPVPNPTPDQNGGKSTVPVTITAANQSANDIQIRALIGAIATGTCTLTLTGPGQTYTSTSNVQELPSSSTCEGFNVPTSSLASGTWTVTITFENTTLQGSATRTINVQ